MDRITPQELQTLVNPGTSPCISLYVSQQPGYPACDGNAKELRHALFQAETKLREAGVDQDEIGALLRPGLDYVRTAEATQAAGNKGLAFLMSRDFVQRWQLPFECESTVDIGPAFRVGPLVRLLGWYEEVRVLALCPTKVRYFECSRSSIRELELPSGVPATLDEFEWGPDVGRAVRFQTSAGAAGTTAVVHGQASFKDEVKTRRDAWVRTVAEQIATANRNDSIPVVLFAVGELHPVFNQAFGTDHLPLTGIHHSPAHLSRAEIHERVTELFSRNVVGDARTAFDRYGAAVNTHRAVSGLETIVAAASAGQVDTLIAAYGERVWGIYQAGSERAIVTESTGQAPAVDLMELAISETLRHRGQVCMVERSAIPDRALTVAALRWTER